MNCRNKITSLALVLVGSCYGLTASAKCGSVDYTQGADALAMMHDYVVTMMLYVLYLAYAFAAIMAIISALQIYIKMNTGEDGITKSIMTLIGAIIFMISASIGLLWLPNLYVNSTADEDIKTMNQLKTEKNVQESN